MGERLMFIGPGRAGLALGYALWQAEAIESITYCGRRPEPPSHPLFTQGTARYCFGLERPAPGTDAVILSVPDDILAEMTHALAGQGAAPPHCAAFHLSGALSGDVLAPLHECGYSVGTLHPLQSLAHPVTGADRLPGSTFSLSGEPGAVRVARRLLGHLNASDVAISVTLRPLYHAAAVMASNHLAVLLGLAGRLLVRAGVPEDEALKAVLPLARGTLENVNELGLGHALTGPVARGDTETVRLHLASMEPREREVYRALSRELTALAEEWGVVDAESAESLRDVLRQDGEGV
jgi:predicted short-subunit dehydrogenase-like oxidoreductase (DUF2520 family)